jgi:hypothetical protein
MIVKHDTRDRLFDIIRESMRELKEKGYDKEALRDVFSPQAQNCYYCDKAELYEVGRNHQYRFSMMECDACDKTYLVDWKKADEVRKYNIILPK